MFDKISTKILVTAIAALTLMAAAIAGVSWKRISDDVYQNQKTTAGNILSLVALNIQSQYNRVVDYEVEFISRRRGLLKQKNATILAYLEAMRQTAKNGALTEDQAKRQSLAWLELHTETGRDFIVFDNDLTSLSQADRNMVGKTLQGFTNMRGGEAFASIRDKLSNKREDYSVIFWPGAPGEAPRKQLAYFTSFPPWGWIIATTEPIDDLETLVASKRETILEEMGRTLSEITVPGSGYLFLFDGNGKILTHPSVPKGFISEILPNSPFTGLFQRFKHAAKTPDVPLSYVWAPPNSKTPLQRKLAFVRFFKPLDWYVCYTIQEADLQAAAAGLIRELMVIILAAAVLCAALLLVLIRRFTRPIVDLMRLVKGLPEREFLLDQSGLDALADLSRRRSDEPGRLAVAFLGLQHKLQSHLGELARLTGERVQHIQALENVNARLEAKVAERTANLVASNERLKKEMRERETAMESLRESEKKFRALAESMPGIIYLSKNDERFTKLYLNDFVQITTGYPKEDFLEGRRNFLDLTHPEDRPKIIEAARRSQTLLSPFCMEYRIRRKDGQWRWVEDYGAAVPSDDGDVAYFEGVINDVTERVEVRETLRAAKNQAEAANIAKSEFLASMSHEIRTPIHIILGVADVLQDADLSPTQAKHMEMLASAGNALLSLISDILDFSKIETGDISLESIAFDLRAVLEEAARSMSVEAHKKGLEFTLRIAPDIPKTLTGDPTRIRQVFANLAGNAIKFTSRGEVEARVTGTDAGDGIRRLSFSIRDTGIGIAKDKLEVIFDRFTQADSSTTRKFGGSGLGLTICKKLVELMGGEVHAKSRLGLGSTFTFDIPLAIQDASPGFDPRALAGLRILTADPVPASGEMLTEALSAMGASAVHVASAVEALNANEKAARENAPFDIALVSVRQDVGDGFSLAERLLEENPEPLRVFMLAPTDALTGCVRRASALGFSGALVKPVGVLELQKRLSRKGQTFDPERSRKAQSASRPDSESQRPLKILIVEDAAPNRALMALYLQDSPHAFDVAENGREAIKRYEADTYDAVFLDMFMPVMDGFEAAQRMRAIESETGRKPARIIALTASAETGAAEKCLAAGCDAYLSKPVDRQTLLATLKSPA